MLVPLIGFLAAAAAQPADALTTSREGYATCLRKFMIANLQKRTPPEDFNKALQPACATQETAFRAAILAADKADRMSDAEAKDDAQFQVDDYLDKFRDNYRDYLESNSQPG